MNKYIYIILFTLLFLLTSCNTTSTVPKSLLEEVIGVTESQKETLEDIINNNNIKYIDIVVSNNALIEEMHEDWEGYDLIDSNGYSYLLIVRKFDKDFTAIIDYDNHLIEGMIDNNLFPKSYNSIIINE